MRHLTSFVLACLVASSLACGGGDGDGGNPTGPSGGGGGGGGTPTNGSMTATIDGLSWTATVITVTNSQIGTPIFSVGGGGIRAGDPATRTTAVAFALANPGIGAFSLGVPTVLAGSMTISVAEGLSLPIWLASPSTPGSSGTVNVTVFTGSRAAGTFNAVLVPSQGGATGNRVVTGTFDVTF